MATLIVCDKCGMSCGNNTKFIHIRAYKLIDADSYKAQAVNYMDVCKECYENIFKEDKYNGN